MFIMLGAKNENKKLLAQRVIIIIDQYRNKLTINLCLQVLRNLEISLRTNNIEWVREFLSAENAGLDVLVDYLSGRLIVMRHTMKLEDGLDDSAVEHRLQGEHKKSSVIGTLKGKSSLSKGSSR